LIAGGIAAGLVDRTDADCAAVDLVVIGAGVGFVAELEHQLTQARGMPLSIFAMRDSVTMRF
jgi:hypothetical protein